LAAILDDKYILNYLGNVDEDNHSYTSVNRITGEWMSSNRFGQPVERIFGKCKEVPLRKPPTSQF
jgi:hypothetical protein